MTNYRRVLKDINLVKKMINGLTFEQAEEKLCGFNGDGTLFDYNFGDFEGTIYNENDKPVIHRNSSYGIFNKDGTYAEECITEDEILAKINRI